MLSPLMPMIRTDLDLNYTQVGVVLSSFAITSGISQLAGGWLADRFGPRTIVAVGVSGVAIGGLFIGFSNSYTVLIVFLVLAAILGGCYHPASITAISTLVPAESRGRALGIHGIGGSTSFWVVPLFAALIATAWGWRGSYITLSIPTILLGIVLYIIMGRRTRVPVSKSQSVETGIPTAPSRIHWRELLPFFFISVAMGTTIQSIIAYLSLYSVDHFGVTEATAAMLMAIIPAVGLFAAPLGGYLSDRIGGVPVLVTAGFLAALLIYILGVVPNIPILVIVMVILGIVHYIRMPTAESYIVEHTPERRRSTILGFYFFAGMEISGLLAPLIGYLIDQLGFYWSFTIASAIPAVVTMVCSLFLLRKND